MKFKALPLVLAMALAATVHAQTTYTINAVFPQFQKYSPVSIVAAEDSTKSFVRLAALWNTSALTVSKVKIGGALLFGTTVAATYAEATFDVTIAPGAVVLSPNLPGIPVAPMHTLMQQQGVHDATFYYGVIYAQYANGTSWQMSGSQPEELVSDALNTAFFPAKADAANALLDAHDPVEDPTTPSPNGHFVCAGTKGFTICTNGETGGTQWCQTRPCHVRNACAKQKCAWSTINTDPPSGP